MSILDANSGYLRAKYNEQTGGLELFNEAGESLSGPGGVAD